MAYRPATHMCRQDTRQEKAQNKTPAEAGVLRYPEEARLHGGYEIRNLDCCILLQQLSGTCGHPRIK